MCGACGAALTDTTAAMPVTLRAVGVLVWMVLLVGWGVEASSSVCLSLRREREMLHYKLSAVLLLTLTHVSLGLTKHWPCL